MRKLPQHLDNPLDTMLIDISEAISPALKATGHTPNLITTYSFGSSLLAIYALHRGNLPAFSVLWALQYFWDCVDGHFARKYSMTSEFGDMYDHVTDITSEVILGLVAFHRYNIPVWLVVVLLVVVVLQTVHLGCQQRYAHGTGLLKGKESLDMAQGLCPSTSWLPWTRWVSPGTMHLIVILAVWYLEKYHKRPGIV